MIDEQNETIPVMRFHLEQIATVLDRAFAKSAAEDLIDHYRNNKGRNPQQSVLTTSLSRAYQRTLGYLGIDEDDVS